MSMQIMAEPVGVPMQTMVQPVQTVQMPVVQYSAPAVQQVQPMTTTYAAPPAGQTFQHQGLTLKVAGQDPALPAGQVFQHQGLQLKVAGQPAAFPQQGQVFQHQGMQLQVAAPASAPTSVQIPAQSQIMARPAGFPRGPQDLLAKGPLVIEQEVTREYLIETGNLIIDERADAAVNARLVAMQAQFVPIDNGVVAEPVGSVGFQPEMPPPHASLVQHVSSDNVHHVPSNHMHPPSNLPDSEWMFGDVATGFLGIHALAHLNPMRWSGSQSIEKTIQDLTDVHTHHDRPISLKIPANVMHQYDYPNAISAIQHCEEVQSGLRQV